MKNEFYLELPTLLEFIKASCHENLHKTMRAIRTNLHPDLPRALNKHIEKLLHTAQLHLNHEERTFHPLLKVQPRQSLNSVIHLYDDHIRLEELLDELSALTNNYQTDEAGFSALFDDLMELDRVFRNHIKLENNVLFPMICEEHAVG